VALGYDGAVLAMAGGRDYGLSQFNRVTQARRQVGSAFKLFVYLAAIEAGYRPDSEVVDRPVTVGSWSPENFGGKYRGTVTLRTAFAESLNSVSVQLSEQIGHRRIIEIARGLGLESPIADVPSLALGTSEHTLLELTRAYAAVAANAPVAPYGVRDVTAGGRQTLYEHQTRPAPPLMSWHRAAILDLLRASVRAGTGHGAFYGRPAAGKTGTTQDYRDAWFIGFTADAIVGVWVGNDDNAAMKGVTGGSLPAAIWRDFMQAADARKSAAAKEAAPAR
jgi:membrane peptidoglycan carboxypeptidase